MQPQPPLTEQAEALKAFLLGSIHAALIKVTEELFWPPTTIEKVDDSIVLLTRSGTQISFEITAKVLDVGTDRKQ